MCNVTTRILQDETYSIRIVIYIAVIPICGYTVNLIKGYGLQRIVFTVCVARL